MARIECADKYEAQKLAGLAGGRGPGISSILDVIGEEVVVGLQDGSAHSILMRGGVEAGELADFFQSIFDGRHRLAGAAADGPHIVLSKG
ncbi:MAG: hypothetical protein MPJ06_06200 [Nitrosopumilus sp.]|nr:hypothetical protein [Nitrosopumilus sp.]MDA7943581.1 hypothetical protein [Nitrosopumilus sp.]MDA7960786.1 hypothetical protein [Nitrosopumilus sp.]MDA7998844.1 hypothetical protein [Nitrosopumilus sp.]